MHNKERYCGSKLIDVNVCGDRLKVQKALKWGVGSRFYMIKGTSWWLCRGGAKFRELKLIICNLDKEFKWYIIRKRILV